MAFAFGAGLAAGFALRAFLVVDFLAAPVLPVLEPAVRDLVGLDMTISLLCNWLRDSAMSIHHSAAV